MADTIWETGKITQVMNPAGAWDNGQKRFRIANFEILRWAKELNGLVETYVVPVGIQALQSADLGAVVRDQELGREFGFYDNNAPVVIDYHQGDGSEGLFGLHSFGVV